MLRKFIIYTVLAITVSSIAYFAFIYYVPYSEGYRSGELIKFSHKGVVFKTWEGELSQGLSGNKIFAFSTLDKALVEKLKSYQGQYVKITYIERYRTFAFWGDTRYFVTEIQKEKSPLFNR